MVRLAFGFDSGATDSYLEDVRRKLVQERETAGLSE